ncbi:ArsR/SmtB family transcription factor [Vibrio panuliri]|uniref:Transcriptional regulator n=1 Tax=Vibrio panuliri TaxID=1381081 RepID=A0A1Q9HB38_9VIBR|nr:winged helix-turn-helix domain-containing protein [Vibrio panuliri]KAB1457599.1 winged helix-turn-helix transcriptional regulator [Vibrio panuliri]OLQ86390.1 transcriptional regulator [Vibrio panuliri]OLQ88997.1 transcriptional regulator [Vibrio panuliri]
MTQCSTLNSTVLEATPAELELEQQFAAQAKALAHPARVRILKTLLVLESMGGCLNGDLVSQLGLAQSTVSEHLRILKAAGFITAEPNPPKTCYRIAPQAAKQFISMFEQITG